MKGGRENVRNMSSKEEVGEKYGKNQQMETRNLDKRKIQQ